MAHNQRDLKHHEKKGQGQHAKRFEADPSVRREISPDELIQDGHKNKEADPPQGQKAPAFVLHLQYLAESKFQNRPAEVKAGGENDGEERVHDRRFDLDEGVVLQINRQKAEGHNKDARHEGQDRDTLEEDPAGDKRDQSGGHERCGRVEDPETAVRDEENRKRTDFQCEL